MSSPSGRKSVSHRPAARRSIPPAAPAGPASKAPAREPDTVVLDVQNRTEASLSQLIRALEQASAGVSGAQQANQSLSAELVQLRQLLGESHRERQSLRQRVASLEQELVKTREQDSRELAYLTEQQDEFVAALLEEHERALTELRIERDRALVHVAELEQHAKRTQTVPGVRRAKDDTAALERELEALRRERDRSRELVRRLQAQRDAAQRDAGAAAARAAELEADVALSAARQITEPAPARRVNQDAVRTNPLPKRPPAEPAAKKPTRRTTATASYGSAELANHDADRVTRPASLPEIEAALAAARPSLPPEELSSAILPVSAPLTDPAPAASPVKRKPNPTERPLGGYSVGPGNVEPERVGAAPRWPTRR